MPEFNSTHFITHIEKVLRDAESPAGGDLKSLVRLLVFVAESAPKELRGSSLFSFVNLALRAHKKKGTTTPDEFGHVVRAYAAIDRTRADTLAQNKKLSP